MTRSTTSSDNQALPVDVDPAALIQALVTEPETGISVCRLSGELIYANDQAARIFLGEDVEASSFVGRSMWDVFPEEWMRERVSIGSKLVETGKPVLVRTIWLGHQVLSWVYPMDTGGDIDQARMLIVSRRSCTPSFMALDMAEGGTLVESAVMRLGELDVLSPREIEVLALVGQGLSIREIAKILCRSEKTVQNHRDSIGSKLGLSNRVKVAEVAKRAALTARDARRVRV